MASYSIRPERANLHGHFSRDLPPVLTIEEGDRVRFRTLDAAWGLFEQPDPFVPPQKFSPRDPELDAGHALCGPIAIRGAEPGMTLAVTIHSIIPGSWGWSIGGAFASFVNDSLGLADKPGNWMGWAIDAETGIATNQFGHRVRCERPFMGVLGVAPAAPGRHATRPPRACGGNIDCKALVAGSTLYLPVQVPGALFSTGDGHAVQGDGEISGVAIECPIAEVELSFALLDSMPLQIFRADTPTGWLTFGLDEDLNQATLQALDDMLNLIGENYGLDRKTAVNLASLLVDMHITQIANGVMGVHAILPHGALEYTLELA